MYIGQSEEILQGLEPNILCITGYITSLSRGLFMWMLCQQYPVLHHANTKVPTALPNIHVKIQHYEQVCVDAVYNFVAYNHVRTKC